MEKVEKTQKEEKFYKSESEAAKLLGIKKDDAMIIEALELKKKDLASKKGLFEKVKEFTAEKMNGFLDKFSKQAIAEKVEGAEKRIEETVKSLGLTKKDKKDALQELKEAGEKNAIDKFLKGVQRLKETAFDLLKIERGFEGKFDVRAKSTASEMHPDENQDSVFAREKEGIFGVFDGMGGTAGGFAASQTAAGHVARKLEALPPESSLEEQKEAVKDALIGASKEVRKITEKRPEIKGASSTASVVKMFEKNGKKKAIIGNVGDSRVYIKRADGSFDQVTLDDSSVAYGGRRGKNEFETQKRLSNYENKSDILEKDEIHWNFRNQLLQAIGGGKSTESKVFEEIEPNIYTIDLEKGDRIIITSDGIHDPLTDKKIDSVLDKFSDSESASQALIDEAMNLNKNDENFRAKPDDKTAVIIGVK